MAAGLSARWEMAAMMKVVVKAAAEICKQCTLRCTPEGVRLHGKDPAGILVVDSFVSRESCSDYSCQAGELRICIPIKSFNTILQCAKDTDKLELFYEEDADQIDVVFSEEGRRQPYSLNVLESTEEIGEPLAHEHAATLHLPRDIFAKVIDDFRMIEGDMKIHVTKEAVQFSVKDDSIKGSVIYKHGTNDVVIECSRETVASFKYKLVKIMTTPKILSPTVVLKVEKNQLLYAIYKMEIGYFHYILAPLMDELDV
jgi:proliferating cell nuclear antigen PCNA